MLAEFAGLADCVHDLAQEVFVGEFVGITSREALVVLVLEVVYLRGNDLLERWLHRLAGLELLAVHKDRGRQGEPSAPTIVVAEMRELSGLHPGRTIGHISFPASHIIEDHLGHVRVVTDHDEDRRGQAPCLRF